MTKNLPYPKIYLLLISFLFASAYLFLFSTTTITADSRDCTAGGSIPGGYCGPDPNAPRVRRDLGTDCGVFNGVCVVSDYSQRILRCGSASCHGTTFGEYKKCENSACTDVNIHYHCCVNPGSGDPGATPTPDPCAGKNCNWGCGYAGSGAECIPNSGCPDNWACRDSGCSACGGGGSTGGSNRERVVGRVIEVLLAGGSQTWQPARDDGDSFSCGASWPSDPYGEHKSGGGLRIENAEGGDADWNCNPSPFYDRKASGSGEGPHLFQLTPVKDLVQCNDNEVGWFIAYPLGWSNGAVQGSPNCSKDGSGNWTCFGKGCTARVFLGPNDWDNHLWWFMTHPDPMCSFTSATANPNPIYVGESGKITTQWARTPSFSDMAYADFTVSDPSILSICDFADPECTVPASTYRDNNVNPKITFTGLAEGSTTVTMTGAVSGVSSTFACTTGGSVTVNVDKRPDWWQVGFGEVVTNGDVESLIPPTCVLPNCTPLLISGLDSNLDGDTNDSNDYRGEGGLTYFGVTNQNTSTVSESGLIIDNEFASVSEYTYNFFTNKVPGFSSITPSAVINFDTAELNSQGTDIPSGGDNYKVIVRNGTTNLQDGADGGTRVNLLDGKFILFVNGDLNINSEVILNDGTGFFMAIVRGNINVNPSVGDVYVPGTVDPELEGIYVTTYEDLQVYNFITGTSGSGLGLDSTLEVRGVVAALGGKIDLLRNVPISDETPAEKFYYGADQTLLVPYFLGEHVYRWREVAP